MLQIILAHDKNFGIGNKRNLPWHSPEELTMFKYKTMDSVLIVGRKTAETLPNLINREIVVVSSSRYSLEEAILLSLQKKANATFVIGGSSIYNEIFKNYKHLISTIHVSIMRGNYECDSFIEPINYEEEYKCISTQNFKDFVHKVYQPFHKCGELQYLQLLSDVMSNGVDTYGRNGKVKSVFGKSLTFNLQEEFPLLTTKKMFLRGIVEELLFFIRGETNSKILEEKGVNIWKANTEERLGLMGPMYGSQWRHFNANLQDFDVETSTYKGGYDQLQNVINLVKTDPKSRRILMTTFNPEQADKGVLYPCHSIVNQFHVDGKYLDMTCYNRSSDLFLGLPFNIASSSLLLHIIAKETGHVPRFFHLYLGDCHIYDCHRDAVSLQLTRLPKPAPQIEVRHFEKIESLTFDMFELENYQSYPSIKADMVR